jgi:hypothetical protein
LAKKNVFSQKYDEIRSFDGTLYNEKADGAWWVREQRRGEKNERIGANLQGWEYGWEEGMREKDDGTGMGGR